MFATKFQNMYIKYSKKKGNFTLIAKLVKMHTAKLEGKNSYNKKEIIIIKIHIVIPWEKHLRKNWKNFYLSSLNGKL